MRNDFPLEPPRSTGLVEVLDRVLDKGLLVAGDIRISLAEVELLTIRIRLIVCSLDKAQEVGSTGGSTTLIWLPVRGRSPRRTRRCGSRSPRWSNRVSALSGSRPPRPRPAIPRPSRNSRRRSLAPKELNLDLGALGRLS
jgi:Gas vesicle protein